MFLQIIIPVILLFSLILKKYFCAGVGDVLRKRNASEMRALFSTPDGYALTRHNVLSKVYAGVCVTRDYTRDGHATSSCLTSCVYLTLSFRLFAHVSSSLANVFIFHRLCDIEDHPSPRFIITNRII